MQHTVARQPAVSDRRPPTPVTVARVRAAPAATSAQLLQRRMGNQGAAAFVARNSLNVSSPHDPAEREATARAAQVMRMPAPAADVQGVSGGSTGVQRCACQPEIQRKAADTESSSHNVSSDIQNSMSGGAPLPSGVRGFMEPRLGAEFGQVRIHTGERAAQLSESVNAHAFTVGSHVFFGKGQYRPDAPTGKELIAHELTHTIQQGASVQRSGAEGAPLVQRDEKKSLWESLTDWGESMAWDMVREIAPSMVPILQKGPDGVLDWIGAKVSAAVDGVFNMLMAPVRAISGVGETLSTLFAPMLATLQTAAGQIARNDCTPLREAADKIEKTAERIITPIVEKLQPVVAKVKEFLNGLWDKIGAPIWGWIKAYAQEQWEQIQWLAGVVQKFYSWIWEKTAWIRSMAANAWTWVKKKLGIGEGAEGQDGLLQWVQGKLEAAWNTLKAKIEPFKKELTAIGLAVGGVLLVISPAGPVLAIGAAVAGAIQGLRWIAANWGKGNAIVQARVYLEKSLIPSLVGAANKLVAAVSRMAGSISSALGSLAAGMMRAVGSLAGSILRFAVSAVQWLADQAAALAAWATGQLKGLSQWLTSALDKLQAFLKQMLALLTRVGTVILDIWGLPVLLGEKVWNLIPACIRDPIVDFIGPIILKQIELFSELAKDNEAWQKTKADVMKIIHLVFKDHDLVGAVKATFHLVLRVFNIPPELLVTIANKAMAAWDVISKKPIEFIKNTVRAIGHGFRLLWENLWEDLKDGLQGWLFGELKDKKINPPASWTDPKDLFFFVLEVLGLSVDHVWELLAKRFDEKKVQAARMRFGQVARALDWINKAIDTTKSPKENAEGIWAKAKDFGGTILTGIAEWVAGKVAEELAIMAAAAAASGGLSEVLDVLRRVYKALLTAKRYARRILDMVNQGLDNILDIAAGSVAKVGVAIHKIMKLGMPVVIGFLAEQVGLGGVGAALRGIIDTLRAKVDEGILWFIDKIKAGLEAIIGAVKAGVAALLNWWNERKSFTSVDGEDHELFFEGEAGGAHLMIASKKQTIRQFLDAYPDKTKPEYVTAESVLGEALRIIYSFGTPKPEEAERRREIIKTQLVLVSAAFAKLASEPPTAADYPDTDEPVCTPAARAKLNKVEHIVGNARPGEKTSGHHGTPGWDQIVADRLTKSWVQMHVISEALGGKAVKNNLISAPGNVNTGYFRSFEHGTRDLALAQKGNVKNVVWVEVRVTWRDDDFAEEISGASGIYFWRGKKQGWVKNKTPLFSASATVPLPEYAAEHKVSLNFSSGTALGKNKTTQSVAKLIKERRPYSSYDDFRKKLSKDAGDDRVTAIEKDDKVVLRDVLE